MADRATLRARLTERVGNNSVFWTDAEKNDAINEAISVWQALTGEWTATDVTVSTAIGTVTYSVPNTIVALQRVIYNGVPLVATSLYELDQGFPTWGAVPSGAPTLWAPLGIGTFVIYPIPDAVQVLTLEGIAEAPWLTSDGATLDLSDDSLGLLLGYAHHVLTFKEGSVELQSTLAQVRAFIDAAAGRNGAFKATAAYLRYMGRQREEDQRPRQKGEPSVGARG